MDNVIATSGIGKDSELMQITVGVAIIGGIFYGMKKGYGFGATAGTAILFGIGGAFAGKLITNFKNRDNG